MSPEQRDDLTWIATNIRRRAREGDALTCLEMTQLSAMLEHIRDGRGACAQVIPLHRRPRLVLVTKEPVR